MMHSIPSDSFWPLKLAREGRKAFRFTVFITWEIGNHCVISFGSLPLRRPSFKLKNFKGISANVLTRICHTAEGFSI